MIPYWLRPRLMFLRKNFDRVEIIQKNGHRQVGWLEDYDAGQIHIKVGEVVCSYQWDGIKTLLTPRAE